MNRAQREDTVAQVADIRAIDAPGLKVIEEVRDPAPDAVGSDGASLKCREPMLEPDIGSHDPKDAQ
jgi:hypothetical protein